MYAFELVKPASLAEAIQALQAEDAQPLGGGQTLIPTLKQRLAAPARLVALADLPELTGVSVADGAITAGGAATHHAIAEAAAGPCPAIAHLAAHIGDPAVRHRGTIGGSLANNDPAACWPAAALACAATLTLHGPNGPRDVAADAYFKGMFETDLRPGEIVAKVRLPIPDRAGYVKFVQPASRFAMVGVFVAKSAAGVRVAVTGAAEHGVFRWTDAEAALAANFSPKALDGLAVPADGLLADIHATPDYRAHLVKVMTRRAVDAA